MYVTHGMVLTLGAMWHMLYKHKCHMARWYSHKFKMQKINNENCVKLVHSYVHAFYAQMSCIENMFDTQINVLMNEIRTYE